MDFASFALISFMLLFGYTDGGMYMSMNHDIPMLQERGDVRLDFDLGCWNTTTSVAYAFGNHWGMQGALQCNIFGFSRYGGQLTAGWFTPLQGHSMVEVYGGASLGHIDMSHHGDFYDGTTQSYFVQADYAWCGLANSHIDIGIGLKGGWLLGDITNTYTIWDELDERSVRRMQQQEYSEPFVEPTVVFRFGWERLKFNLNASMTLSKDWGQFSNPEPRVGLGLNYYFHTANKVEPGAH